MIIQGHDLNAIAVLLEQSVNQVDKNRKSSRFIALLWYSSAVIYDNIQRDIFGLFDVRVVLRIVLPY